MPHPDADKLLQLAERMRSLDDAAIDRLRQQLMSEAAVAEDDEGADAIHTALEMIDDELDRRASG